MEKALKAVYDIHRQAVLESNQSASKFKTLNERLTEKYKKLQKDYELLTFQNKHLQDAAFNKQNRGGDCCAALRSSLETIGTTYKQLLEEKDNRIRQLEAEIRKYKRRSSAIDTGSLDFTQDTQVTPDRKSSTTPSSRHGNKDTSPDSTSRANNETGSHSTNLIGPFDSSEAGPQTISKTGLSNGHEISINYEAGPYRARETSPFHHQESRTDDRHQKDRTASAHNSPGHEADVEEELVFVDRSDVHTHQPKLKLQKGRLKRNRYTEDSSPENKRPRQSSSPRPGVSENHKKDTLVNNEIAPSVLVPDTCQTNLDETVAKSYNDNANRTVDHKLKSSKVKKQNKRTNDTDCDKANTVEQHGVLVVPETLAASIEDDIESDHDQELDDRTYVKKVNNSMDVVSDTDESENEASQCTLRERNKQITELSMRSILRSSDSQGLKSDKTESLSQLQDGTYKRQIGLPILDKRKSIDMSTRNILDSPDSQKYAGKHVAEAVGNEIISHKTLNLSGESEVFELDSDDDSRGADVIENKKLPAVGDDFQSSGGSSQTDKNKPSKLRKEILMEENESHVELRRSPRKLKEVRYYGTPKKSKKKLRDSSQLTESEIHEMFSSPTSSSADETDIAMPPLSAIHKKDGSYPAGKNPDNIPSVRELESQSVDCYNVVPVQDGVPISKKKFQLAVPRNKSKYRKNDTESERKISHLETELTVPTEGNDVLSDLKSPSIIAEKPIVSNRSEAGKGSNSSASSLTDPESPLLLKGNPDNNEESDGTRSRNWDESDSGWLKTKKKNLKDKNVSGVEAKKGNNSNEKQLSKKTPTDMKNGNTTGIRKSARIKPIRNLCQTTLTQSFFRSPSKKGQPSVVKDSDHKLDHDLQEAIRLSLEEAQSSQQEEEQLHDADVEILDFGTEKENSPPFKRPSILPRSALRRRGLQNKQTKSLSDLDETLIPKITKVGMDQALKEVSTNEQLSQRSNSEGHNSVEVPRLNGSIDPAMELSELCADSSTFQSLPSLDRDFSENLNRGTSLPKTSTIAEEDSQEIPSSSRSYKFGTKKKLRHQKSLKAEDSYSSQQQMRHPVDDTSLDTTFDHVPKKKSPEIAHVAVVRKRDERQKLKGYSCRECYEYYKSKGLSEDEIQKHIQDCSRHRAKHVKPDTPPHFWSVGFIDTQECVDRGYLKIETDEHQEKDTRTFRRRQPLEKRFKAKNETTFVESPDSDIEV